MSLEEARLGRLEAELDRLRPSLYERLERLEQLVKDGQARTPESGRARLVRWMGAELPKFLTAALMLIFGFAIKDSVDLSIKRRQLDLSYTKEMQQLLQKMGESKADTSQIGSAAVLLAAYGDAAVTPLVSELRYGGLRADGAATGLSTLALTNPTAVCEALPRVLATRGRQFGWESQVKVVRLLGESNCREASVVLGKYRRIVVAAAKGETKEFASIASDLPLAPEDDYPRILKEIDRSLLMLKPQAEWWNLRARAHVR